MMTMPTCVAPLARGPSVHSEVHGVHGSTGATGWKAFYTRRDLRSPSEAVEWAFLPPGAVSGEHRHTRTEEIYLILKGEGEYFLNGRAHHAKPGTLALMTPGNTHGLRNVGAGPLEWLVVETLTPRTETILSRRNPPRSLTMSPQIADLTITPRVDASGIFEGPLSAVERHLCAPESVLEIQHEGHEAACFLNQGSATLQYSGVVRPLSAPVAFLVPPGRVARLMVETKAEVYVVALRVSPT